MEKTLRNFVIFRRARQTSLASFQAAIVAKRAVAGVWMYVSSPVNLKLSERRQMMPYRFDRYLGGPVFA